MFVLAQVLGELRDAPREEGYLNGRRSDVTGTRRELFDRLGFFFRCRQEALGSVRTSTQNKRTPAGGASQVDQV